VLQNDTHQAVQSNGRNECEILRSIGA